MTALWIILGILAVLVVLLCLPVILYVAYDRQWELSVRYIIRFRLFPSKQKQKKKKSQKAEKQAPKAEEQKKPEQALSEILDLLGALRSPAKMLLRRLKIYGVCLWVRIAKEEASDTAIAYGRLMAYCNAAYAALCGFFSIRLKRIDLQPDFQLQQNHTTVRLQLRCRISLGALLAIALCGLFGFLKRQQKRQAAQKTENAPEQKASTAV